ncbi:V-type ATPase 116kDa subunit family protein [Malonomonas rubra]|uniref:V-type ATPase 116kDa subunit family protein n=1 Tax=Malonomonas rubra TaxID=57040 RepID=UPI0026F2C1E8|nr:V-type ATPase 116kDa subunit family protein [Malonomonas rubra]
MIIKMAKIEIVGPKDLLLDTLELLRGKGVFHPEADARGFVRPEDEAWVKELLLDQSAIGEKQFFVALQEQIRQLLACLPDLPSRTSYLPPLPIIDVLNELVDKHLLACRNWQQQCHALREEADRLTGHLRFWRVLEPLVADVVEHARLAFFGVTIRNADDIPKLRDLLEQQTEGRCRLSTTSIDDGSIVGLITADLNMEERLRKLLFAEKVPELDLPKELAALPFRDKPTAVQKLLDRVAAELQEARAERETFAHHWLPIYRQTLAWLDERLSLYQASALAYETRQCFLINGWMPSEGVEELRQVLANVFAGRVVLSVLELHQEDYDRVPVLLRNPLYFKPFELFARLLPLPKYSSYDPTPFLGLFFPLLFGMILGDIGYGLLLGVLAGLVIRFCPQRETLVDAARILGVSAAYAVLFGLFYGELFGNLGEQLFHLQPIWQERSRAVVPMITFAISVGTAHILLGLLLGIHYDFKRHLRREAFVKLINLLLICLCGIWLVGFLFPFPWQLTWPLLLAVLLLLPVLIIAGGLLAPLELLKSFGNIISYVRIMAIGLCSVLLAQVANQLGGMTGDLVAGFLVAGVLHFFNLILGVFAPTVHALRLHYVEFFSKFLEFGGRRYQPLEKNHQTTVTHSK